MSHFKCRILSSALAVTGLLSGCSHFYYVPNVHNVPIFTAKDEYRMSLYSGVDEVSVSTEIQAAYSVTDHIGVMTNYISTRGIENSEESSGNGNFLEGGAGYFRTLGKSGVFEIYGGAGGSRQEHLYATRDFDPHDTLLYDISGGSSSLKFLRLFVQPSIGLRNNWLEFAFSTRICRLSFNKIDNQIDMTRNKYEYDKLNSLVNDRYHMYFEPAITIRAGWDHVKIQMQGSMASYFNQIHYFNGYHLSIGIFGSISGKEWKPDMK